MSDLYNAHRLDTRFFKAFFPKVNFGVVLGESASIGEAIITLKGAGKLPVGQVRLSSVPYCCGNLWLFGLRSYSDAPGVGSRLLQIATRAAELMGYCNIQCVIPSVAEDWEKQTSQHQRPFHTFLKEGYELQPAMTVRNVRSGNYLFHFQKKIKPLNQMWPDGDVVKVSNHFTLPEEL